MLTTLLLVTASCLAATCNAGRAFPSDSEMYAANLFASFNKNLKWDDSNYLVDLSGNYATCSNVFTAGFQTVDVDPRRSIAAYVGWGNGVEKHVDAVNLYLKEKLDSWVKDAEFQNQLRKAETFGCSVQPGCQHQFFSVACLFSPGYNPNNGGGNIRDPTRPSVPRALAFTHEQYRTAEDILGMKWDRKHLLENLSGHETDCAMIDNFDWTFAYAKQEAKENGLTLKGLYGWAPNNKNVPSAIEKVLMGWKKVKAEQVGCSVIPDCRNIFNEETVVVSCLFADKIKKQRGQ